MAITLTYLARAAHTKSGHLSTFVLIYLYKSIAPPEPGGIHEAVTFGSQPWQVVRPVVSAALVDSGS